jgi:hypothetical protein
MAADASNGVTQRPSQQKRCFVVSEYGRTETERLERSQVLRHLIRKVLEPLGYDVKRADEIDDPGQITHQVIERLIDDELVVADLTNRNPNVFYELAVRHAARRPVVTIMAAGQDIPFDVKDVRTVFYDLHDPDKLELAQRDLTEKVRAIEANPTEIRNPITVASDLSVLRRSDDPEARVAGALLENSRNSAKRFDLWVDAFPQGCRLLETQRLRAPFWTPWIAPNHSRRTASSRRSAFHLHPRCRLISRTSSKTAIS